MERYSTSFLAMNLILLFIGISFVLVVFDLHRFAFVFELMLLLVFMFLLAFAMYNIYHNQRWGWTLLGTTLIFLLLDLFFIFVLTRTLDTPYITSLVFSVIGLVITALNLREIQDVDEIKAEEYEKAADYYPYIDKMESKEGTKETSIEKTFIPGKFVASKKANKFHIAKCDWARRVSKENRIWFNSKEEAESQGFQADKCVG